MGEDNVKNIKYMEPLFFFFMLKELSIRNIMCSCFLDWQEPGSLSLWWQRGDLWQSGEQTRWGY